MERSSGQYEAGDVDGMFTPLHRALGLSPGPFDLDLVRQAVEGKVKEESDLDWKQNLYHSQNPTWQDEAAKDIAAMANSGGGWVVFGVAEADDRADRVTPVSWTPAEEQRLRQAVFTRTTPAVLGIEFHVVEQGDGSGWVVGLRVPNSDLAPHFCRVKDDFTLRCPRRDGSHTVFMPERDIERAYVERFRHRQEWRERLTDLQEEALASMDFSNTVGAVAVAAPRESSPPTALDRNNAADVLSKARYDPLYEEHSHYPCLPHEGQPYPGYRSQRFRDTSDFDWGGACALHHDGSATLAMHLGRLGLDNDRTPDTAASHWVFKCVADFISLTVAHARATGRGGTYGAVFELRGPSPFYIELGREHHLSLRRDALFPITRFTPVPFEIDPESTRDELVDLAKSVAHDVVNQGGLDQLGLTALQARS